MTTHTPRITRVLLAVGILSISSSARAQPASNAQSKAQALFEEGRQKDCPTAIPLFEQSLALFESRGALLNLASCLEAVGRLVEAESAYRRLQPKLKTSDDRGPIVQAALDKLAKRIAKLTVLPPADASGIRARFGGDLADSELLPFTRRVDPGREFVLLVESGDGSSTPYKFLLEEGRDRTFTVPSALPPASGVAPTQPAPVSASGLPVSSPQTPRPDAPPEAPDADSPSADAADWPTRVGSIGVFVGTAALLGALVVGGVALGQKSALEEECPVAARCSDKGKDIARSGQTLTDVGTGLAIGGAVLAGAGVVVVVFSGPGETRVGLTPSGAVFSGTF
jgi:hypothetical protein